MRETGGWSRFSTSSVTTGRVTSICRKGGVAIHRIADLPALKITPFVRRAIESRLLPVIADGMR